MQVNDTAKTKLVPRARRLLEACLIFVLVAVFAIVGILVAASRQSSTRTLYIDDQKYSLEIADTDKTRSKGLGDRQSLSKDRGMLFVFDKPERTCFWMKDMQFSIDIIWTDSSGRVLHVVRNLSPATYPQDYCVPGPAKYVIELNAGQAQSHNIRDGSKLNF